MRPPIQVALLLAIALGLASCGGGGGPRPPVGGNGDCPSTCLEGDWLFESTVIETDESALLFGLESAHLDLDFLLNDSNEAGVYEVFSQSLQIPKNDAGHSAFGLAQDIQNGYGFIAGVYYDAAHDVSVDVNLGGSLAYYDQSQLLADDIVLFADFEVYEGDVLVQVQGDDGDTGWEIDGSANLLKSGVIRIDGRRTSSLVQAPGSYLFEGKLDLRGELQLLASYDMARERIAVAVKEPHTSSSRFPLLVLRPNAAGVWFGEGATADGSELLQLVLTLGAQGFEGELHRIELDSGRSSAGRVLLTR